MKFFASSRFLRLAKEGGWILVGQVAAVTGGLALIRVLTEHLDPEQYGQLALALTLVGLINQVVMGGISTGIGRFYSIAGEAQDLAGYLNTARRMMGIVTGAVVVIAILLVFGLHLLGFSQWVPLALTALIFALLSGYNATLTSIQTAARQRAIVAFHLGLDAWIKIFLTLGLLIWLGVSATSVLVCYILSSLLVTVSQFYFLSKLKAIHGDTLHTSSNWMKRIWAYSLPVSVWGVFTWTQQISDRWALQQFTDAQEVGLFAVVFQLGYVPIGLALGMVTNFLGPILYQRSGNLTDAVRNKSVHLIAWRITLLGLLVTILGFVLALLFHNWIFLLAVSPDYQAVSYLLPWMILAGGLFASGQILSLKLMSEMKSGVMAPAKIATAILGVALNIYGAAQFGLQGVVGAMVMFSCIYLIWMAWLAMRLPQVNEL